MAHKPGHIDFGQIARENAVFSPPNSGQTGASTTASLIDILSAAASIGGVGLAAAGGQKHLPLANILTSVPFALNQTSRLFSERAAAGQRIEQQNRESLQASNKLRGGQEFLASKGVQGTTFMSQAVVDSLLKQMETESRGLLQSFSEVGEFRVPAPTVVPTGVPESRFPVTRPSLSDEQQHAKQLARLSIPEIPRTAQPQPVAPAPQPVAPAPQNVIGQMAAIDAQVEARQAEVAQKELRKRAALEKTTPADIDTFNFPLKKAPLDDAETFVFPDGDVPLAPAPATAPVQPRPDPLVEQKRSMIIQMLEEDGRKPGQLSQSIKALREIRALPEEDINAVFSNLGLALPQEGQPLADPTAPSPQASAVFQGRFDSNDIASDVENDDGTRTLTDSAGNTVTTSAGAAPTREGPAQLLPIEPSPDITSPLTTENEAGLTGQEAGQPALQSFQPPTETPTATLISSEGEQLGKPPPITGPVDEQLQPVAIGQTPAQPVSGDTGQALADVQGRIRAAGRRNELATQPSEGVRLPTETEFNAMSRGEKIALIAALDEQGKQEKLAELERRGFQQTGASRDAEGNIRSTFTKPDPAINARQVFSLAVDVMNNDGRGDPFNLSALQLRFARANNVDPSVLDDVSLQVVNATLTEFARQIKNGQAALPADQQLTGPDLTARAASRTVQHLGPGIQGLLGDVLNTLPDDTAFAGLTPRARNLQQEQARQQGLVDTAEEQAARVSGRQAAEEGREAVVDGKVVRKREKATRVQIADADSVIRKLRNLIGAGTQLDTRSRLRQFLVSIKKGKISIFEDDTPDTRAIRFMEDFRSGIEQFMRQLGAVGQVTEEDAKAFRRVTPEATDSIFKIRSQAMRLLKDAILKRNALAGSERGDEGHITINKLLEKPAAFLTETFGASRIESDVVTDAFDKAIQDTAQ